MEDFWPLVTRLTPDLIALFILWRILLRVLKKRTKKKRNTFLWKVFLPRLLLVLLLVYVVVPVGVGAVFYRARYFPQLLEAHRLALYYRPFTLIPGVAASPHDIARQASAAARVYGVDPVLVRAVIATESSGRQFAISNVGACGLMQLMPDTFFDLRGGNPFIARDNIRAGTAYLRKLLDMFGGNLDLALAAYNAGPTNVLRRGAVPPGTPTRYVHKVRTHMKRIGAGG